MIHTWGHKKSKWKKLSRNDQKFLTSMTFIDCSFKWQTHGEIFNKILVTQLTSTVIYHFFHEHKQELHIRTALHGGGGVWLSV